MEQKDAKVKSKHSGDWRITLAAHETEEQFLHPDIQRHPRYFSLSSNPHPPPLPPPSLSFPQTLRPFLVLCQKYLALLGSAPISSNLHVGLFISLSSELAVTAAPLHHRLQLGMLYQRKTIRELQVHTHTHTLLVYLHTLSLILFSSSFSFTQTLAPAIDWLGCLQAAFHPYPVSQLDQVLLHNVPYIIQMSRIIGRWLNKHELSAR